MPKIDPATLPVIARTGYPPPHDRAVDGRSRVQLALAGGLTQFGANLVTHQPGAASSQRHWHSHEDELVIMLEGEAVLVEEGVEAVLGPGDIAAFPAGVPNAHRLENRSAAPCRFIAIGTDLPDRDVCTYPDIGMLLTPEKGFHFPGEVSGQNS
jgi:uncharacterized cupin superfamily protein